MHRLKRLLGVPIETDLSRYERVVRAAAVIDLARASDGELADRAGNLRTDIVAASHFAGAPDKGAALPMTALCLALAREASARKLGLEPYGQQLVAAAAMCVGKVAQMQTGEGKTLAAALAAVFCAMRDGCVHVVTANDYLARRDAEWMRPIYDALGLSVSAVSAADAPGERRAAYGADIVYLTARELGFDYLRDGLARSADDFVQRGFTSAIVDEADFILIDEARVPLVIAGDGGGPGGDAALSDAARDAPAADRVACGLSREFDYRVDPEGRKASLTLAGQAKVESFFGAGGMHSEEAAPLFARAHAALHARFLLKRDVDYLVKDGKIKLVDAFTGRVAEKRQWPWGIQAALEAKEGLEIGREGRVYGSIAVQHLVGLYPKLAAMTATAVPAAGEFSAVYGMGTVVIPPRRPSRRRDEGDAVFWDRESKARAVVAEVLREHRRGRPILVGTASVRESEEIGAALLGEGVACVILNARNDEAEARLIAAAGLKGAVTVSTNMAGRGVDIGLGGDSELLELGGLYVIGTNKHESRRVDDQLRGRAGRQGDPGLTRFFLSLEDPLFERHGARALLPAAYRRRSACAGGPIDDPSVTRELRRAQSIIEGQNSAIRRSLRKYSLLVEYDRRYLRELRDEALRSGALPPAVEEAIAAEGVPEPGPGARFSMALAFIDRLDAAWAEHLALVEDVKEGMGLFRYGGRDPGIEFVRIVGGAFEGAMRDLESAAIADCRAILHGAARAPGEAPPPRPSSTWTYAIEADALPGAGSALREIEAGFRAG